VLRYHIIPKITAGEEAFKKNCSQTGRQNDRHIDCQ